MVKVDNANNLKTICKLEQMACFYLYFKEILGYLGRPRMYPVCFRLSTIFY